MCVRVDVLGVYLNKHNSNLGLVLLWGLRNNTLYLVMFKTLLRKDLLESILPKEK